MTALGRMDNMGISAEMSENARLAASIKAKLERLKGYKPSPEEMKEQFVGMVYGSLALSYPNVEEEDVRRTVEGLDLAR